MKVNVANYIITDLSKRFPLQNDSGFEDDIIDVLISKWSNKEYIMPNRQIKLYKEPETHINHLM